MLLEDDCILIPPLKAKHELSKHAITLQEDQAAGSEAPSLTQRKDRHQAHKGSGQTPNPVAYLLQQAGSRLSFFWVRVL